MVEVKQMPWELELAGEVGVKRMARSLSNGHEARHGARDATEGEAWWRHILGACGEQAFAKATGRYWDGSVGTFKDGGDVGRVQVRTRSQHGWALIVRTDDADDDVFVLVTGMPPVFQVVGWITARDAKRDEWLKDYGQHGAAFFVPQAELRQINAKATP